jgi:hypothetical protein
VVEIVNLSGVPYAVLRANESSAGRGKEFEENGFGVVLDKKRARPRGPALVVRSGGSRDEVGPA